MTQKTSAREARRALRLIQNALDSTVPEQRLARLDRNDVAGWAALAMLEMRMLLARGQTYYGRKFADRLRAATKAGLSATAYPRQQMQLLINGIDAVQAGRHYLALHQLWQGGEADDATLKWASQMWRGRALAQVGQSKGARAAGAQALALADQLPSDAKALAMCAVSEIDAMTGTPQGAEQHALQALSQFIGEDEPRGAACAYLCLAQIARASGATADCLAAGQLAQEADYGWGAPVVLRARMMLSSGNADEALEQLRSIPNPTADAYNLLAILAQVAEHGIPLEAVRQLLELSEAIPNDESAAGLSRLVDTYPGLTAGRDALAWKLIYLDRAEEARRELDVLVDASADNQSIAALCFALQLHAQLSATPRERVSADTGQDDRRTPQATPAVAMAAAESAKTPAMALAAVSGAAAAGEASDTSAGGVGPAGEGFVGQLSLFGPPDLIQFLAAARRSGTVVFSSRQGDARVRLHNGALYWAVSPRDPNLGDFIGDALNADLRGAAWDTDDEMDKLSERVANAGLDAGLVGTAIRRIVHRTLKEVAEWSDGWFMFEGREDATIEPSPDLLLDAQGALLDVLREIDEANRPF